jgi:hypothetical protein
MNLFLIQTMLVASSSDGEEAIWMQILVLVILAASLGVYTFIKNRPEHLKNSEQDFEGTGLGYTKSFQRSHQRHQNTYQNKGIEKQKSPVAIKDIRVDTLQVSEPAVVPLHNSSVTGREKSKNLAGNKMRDTNSGMELLELNLLLQIVHDTKGKDKNEVTMRNLAFNELLRRKNQNRIKSAALAVYAVNRNKLYGKGIQCEAMKVLAERTMNDKQ